MKKYKNIKFKSISVSYYTHQVDPHHSVPTQFKATGGGGVEGSKIMLGYFERSHRAEKDVENRIKKHCP